MINVLIKLILIKKKTARFKFNLDVKSAVNDIINKFEDLTLQDTLMTNGEILKY